MYFYFFGINRPQKPLILFFVIAPLSSHGERRMINQRDALLVLTAVTGRPAGFEEALVFTQFSITDLLSDPHTTPFVFIPYSWHLTSPAHLSFLMNTYKSSLLSFLLESWKSSLLVNLTDLCHRAWRLDTKLKTLRCLRSLWMIRFDLFVCETSASVLCIRTRLDLCPNDLVLT